MTMTDIPALLADRFGLSTSEARRLIHSGAVYVDDVRVIDHAFRVACSRDRTLELKVGKHRFLRLRFS